MTDSHQGWRRSIVVVSGTAMVFGAALLALSFLPPEQRPMSQPPMPMLEAGLAEFTAPTPPPPAPTVRQSPPSLLEGSEVRQPSPALPISPPKAMTGKPKVRPAMNRMTLPSDTAPPPATEQPPSTPEPSPDMAGGTSGARAIFQPLPDIPAELRRHAVDVIARVRFTIASDGTASADLIEATPDPRLNQVLLETFRRWRFFPAVERGKPTASVLVLTVPISIR